MSVRALGSIRKRLPARRLLVLRRHIAVMGISRHYFALIISRALSRGRVSKFLSARRLMLYFNLMLLCRLYHAVAASLSSSKGHPSTIMAAAFFGWGWAMIFDVALGIPPAAGCG